MAQMDGNPIIWGVDQIGMLMRYIGGEIQRVGWGDSAATVHLPEIRRVTTHDLREIVGKGIDDFAACRSDVAFLCVFYPIIGLLMAWIAFDRNLLPLLFPVISGFALIGPLAAVGLYEMSRRRELGEEIHWSHAFGVVKSPSFLAIIVLGALLLGIFLVWILTANAIYYVTMGPEAPASLGAFIRDLFTTGAGWAMIVIGCAIGFVFAVVVLAISVVSFPLLLDRPVGVPVAVITSIRVAARNPTAIAAWGLIVAVALVLGSIPLFLGLIVVLPVLGHATWHLYRKAVAPE
jgi:uncharacterized membrane protein